MATKEDFDKRNIIESISELWELLSPTEQEYLMENIRITCLHKNEIIYQTNEYPQFLMCLLKGKVKYTWTV